MTLPPINQRVRLPWALAVAAMKRGAIVRRASECFSRMIAPENDAEHEWSAAAIYETGQEGCYLAHAWTVDEKAVLVFMGASSKTLFVPDEDHTSANDWIEIDWTET